MPPRKSVPTKKVTARRKATKVKVKSQRSKDAVSRTVRGAVQFGIAETLLRMLEAFGPTLNENQHIALLGFLTLVVTAVQNVLENAEFIPRLLRSRD